MSPATENTPQRPFPLRAETLSPDNDWPTTWRLIRIQKLMTMALPAWRRKKTKIFEEEHAYEYKEEVGTVQNFISLTLTNM